MNQRKLVKTIDAPTHITEVYWTVCNSCSGTGGPDKCTEGYYVGGKREMQFRPKPHEVCCSCKGKKGYRSTHKQSKYICVGGPLDGTWHVADYTGEKTNYVLFNRSSRWQGYKDIMSAVLVFAPKARLVKVAK